MIQPLRQCHRWTFEALGILLPVIFLASLAVRPPATKVAAIVPPPTGHKIFESDKAWKHSIHMAVYSDGSATEVALNPAAPLKYADLLLYWSPRLGTNGHGIVSDAKLLGSFEAGRRYRLPEDWKRGGLLLYSVVLQEVVDQATLDRP